MSTGSPLNLPKPKATTNTGQDMIEVGNSLQKINDRFGTVSGQIGLLNTQVRYPTAIQGFDCNIRDERFRFVSLYQGVNAPNAGAAVLLHMPYSSDWIAQEFRVIGDTVQKWQRTLYGGNTWTAWKSF